MREFLKRDCVVISESDGRYMIQCEKGSLVYYPIFQIFETFLKRLCKENSIDFTEEKEHSIDFTKRKPLVKFTEENDDA